MINRLMKVIGNLTVLIVPKNAWLVFRGIDNDDFPRRLMEELHLIGRTDILVITLPNESSLEMLVMNAPGSQN